MIIAKLIGGLGNQMFQYALGRSLAHLNKTELKLDLTDFTNYKQHSYSLNYFNIIENLAIKKEINQFKKYQRKPGKIWFLYNRLVADETKYIKEKQFPFDSKMLQLKSPVYLDGYWQTEKYFSNKNNYAFNGERIEEIIRKEFTLKKPLSSYSKSIEGEISKTNSISLHVRRGNLVTNPVYNAFHGLCSIEYYQNAIEFMVKNVSSPHFFIFSDDYEWIVENFKSLQYPFTCIKNDDDKNYEDLILMSRCNHHIIANSSFSWWGAWLNSNKNKIVIAPKKWSNAPKNNTKDLLPNGWRVI